MSEPAVITGDLPSLCDNTEDLYEGTLWYYLNLTLGAPNCHHPYHGTLKTAWLCYQAVRYYRAHGELTKRRARNLLVAAFMYDWKHSGQPGHVCSDRKNLLRAQIGLHRHAHVVDIPRINDIAPIMWATCFPHKQLAAPSLEEQIIRDADVAQVLSPVWFTLIVQGLATEWGKSPTEMLELQDAFLCKLHFATEWAQERYLPEAIAAKRRETQVLLLGLSTV